MASAGSGVEFRWNLALAQARSFRTIPRARPMHDAAKNSGPHGRGLAGPLPAGPAAGKKGQFSGQAGKAYGSRWAPLRGLPRGQKTPCPPCKKYSCRALLALPCLA